MDVLSKEPQLLERFCHESEIIFIMGLNPGHVKFADANLEMRSPV